MFIKNEVKERYAQGAQEVQADLCCPVSYDQTLLKTLPQEIVDKDYGCGDPSRYVKEGDIVLDLGSGGGKICYMAAQMVGQSGRVIGVDMTEDMLALARKYQGEMADKIGYDNVSFHRGYIQDLQLDLDAVEAYLLNHPIINLEDMEEFEAWKHKQRKTNPMIPDHSVDLVISNCVLNLVAEEDKKHLINEVYRVLKPGGRVAISDIISDEPVPHNLRADETLWSGCISGAYHEKEFLDAFKHAGFVAVAYDKWDSHAWRVVENIEFRSVTLTAVKGEGSECIDRGHAAIYKGPYDSVTDDEGHIFPRGERIAVCERTFNFLTQGPLKNDFVGITPNKLKDPVNWCAPAGTIRSSQETKNGSYVQTAQSSSSCC